MSNLKSARRFQVGEKLRDWPDDYTLVPEEDHRAIADELLSKCIFQAERISVLTKALELIVETARVDNLSGAADLAWIARNALAVTASDSEVTK